MSQKCNNSQSKVNIGNNLLKILHWTTLTVWTKVSDNNTVRALLEQAVSAWRLVMSISGLGNQDALRGYGQVGRTPLLGQVDGAATATAPAAASPSSDRSTLSAELGESEGGANQLLAAWGTQPAAAAPPLAISGVNAGPQAGFSLGTGGVGGLERGMHSGGVMMGPILRS